MTICADRSAGVSASDGFRVNTLSIRQKWPIADPASLHNRLVTVTLAAGLSNGTSVDCRIGIACRQDCRQIAVLCVAVKTPRSFCSISNRQSVEAMDVVAVWSSMEQTAGKRWNGLSGAVTTLTVERWLGGSFISSVVGGRRR
ncbi:MAG: hypothetical protein ACRD6N_04805 [Pyrinomonadaceae bacterium]